MSFHGHDVFSVNVALTTTLKSKPMLNSCLKVNALLVSCFQAVIQNPFSNGGSPAGETVGGETRFAYFPTSVSDGTGTAVSVQATAEPTITQAGGEISVTCNCMYLCIFNIPLRILP